MAPLTCNWKNFRTFKTFLTLKTAVTGGHLHQKVPDPPWAQNVTAKSCAVCRGREAARECRRKKKEYVKCLENRVAVLENQNKTLIEELKALKDLYCHKSE